MNGKPVHRKPGLALGGGGARETIAAGKEAAMQALPELEKLLIQGKGLG